MPCQFNYDPNLWGTVTDWLVVGLTLFTAVFLYKNFDEQVKINKATILKHKNDLMPIFRIDAKIESFSLYVSNAPAFDVFIFPTDTFYKRSDDEATEGFHDFWDIDRFPVKIKYDEYRKMAQIDTDNFDRQFSIWEITFADQEGRRYQQKISGDKFGAFIDFPKLLKDI